MIAPPRRAFRTASRGTDVRARDIVCVEIREQRTRRRHESSLGDAGLVVPATVGEANERSCGIEDALDHTVFVVPRLSRVAVGGEGASLNEVRRVHAQRGEDFVVYVLEISPATDLLDDEPEDQDEHED